MKTHKGVVHTNHFTTVLGQTLGRVGWRWQIFYVNILLILVKILLILVKILSILVKILTGHGLACFTEKSSHRYLGKTWISCEILHFSCKSLQDTAFLAKNLAKICMFLPRFLPRFARFASLGELYDISTLLSFYLFSQYHSSGTLINPSSLYK